MNEKGRWQWGLPIVMLVLFSIIVRVCPPQTARVASSGRGSIARRAASSSVGRAGGRRPIRSRRDGRRPPHHRTNQESPVKDTAYGTVDMAKAGGARNDAKSTPDRPLKDTVLYPRATTFIPGDSRQRMLEYVRSDDAAKMKETICGFLKQDRIKIFPNDYTVMINACRKYGEWQLVLQLVEHARNRGVLNAYQISAAFAGLGPRWRMALRLLHQCRSDGIALDIVAYNSVITQCCRSHDWEKALGVREMLLNDGVKQDSYTMHNLLKAIYRSHQWQRAEELIAEMDACSLRRSTEIYNIKLSASSQKEGGWREAISIFNEMRQQNISRTTYTYNTLISCMEENNAQDFVPSSSSDEDYDLHEGQDLPYEGWGFQNRQHLKERFRLLKASNDGDDDDWKNPADSQEDGQWNMQKLTVEGILTLMERDNLRKDVVTYNAIMQHQKRDLFSVLRSFYDIDAQGIRRNTISFTNVIAACRHHQEWERALDFIKEMHQSQIRPSLQIINHVAAALMEEKPARAISFLDRYEKSGLKLNVVSHSIKLASLRKTRDWQLAESYFNSIHRGATPPSISLFNTLFSVLQHSRRWERAFETFRFLRNGSCVLPDVVQERPGDLQSEEDKAFSRILEEARGVVHPDAVSYTTMIAICRKEGLYERGFQFIKELEDSKIRKDTVTYNAILAFNSKSYLWESALSVLEEMKRKRVRTDAVTYHTAIQAANRAGKWELTLKLFDQMEEDGFEENAKTVDLWLEAARRLANEDMSQS